MNASPTDLSGASVTTTMSPDRTLDNPAKRETGGSVSRIAALDFTKGALVLFMVLYHWLSYFHGPHGLIFRYLRFLPPSFIFIAGFLVSNVYLSKYGLNDSRLPRRLSLRGLKILGLFILLNAAVSFLFTGFRNLSIGNLTAVYVTGNVLIAGVGKAAAFYILVPISYLLLLSAILVPVCGFYKHTFYAVTALFILGIFVLSLYGLQSSNLELVTVGLLGLLCGYIPIEKINRFVRRRPYALAALYLCYLAAVTVREPNYPLQVAGVGITLMMIYLLATSGNESGGARNLVILLGKYSLFGYIAQVAILQVLRSGLRHFDAGPVQLVMSFVIALSLTVISVVTLDHARSRWRTVDRLYKGVFA